MPPRTAPISPAQPEPASQDRSAASARRQRPRNRPIPSKRSPAALDFHRSSDTRARVGAIRTAAAPRFGCETPETDPRPPGACSAVRRSHSADRGCSCLARTARVLRRFGVRNGLCMRRPRFAHTVSARFGRCARSSRQADLRAGGATPRASSVTAARWPCAPARLRLSPSVPGRRRSRRPALVETPRGVEAWGNAGCGFPRAHELGRQTAPGRGRTR
jgi:hypothetical protein